MLWNQHEQCMLVVFRGVKMDKPTQTKPYPNGFKLIWVMVLTDPFDKWIGSIHNTFKWMS